MDVERLARILHESGRAAVEAGKVVNRIPGQPFLGWDAITEDAREGRRMQARYLLEHLDIRDRSMGADHECG